MGSCPIIPLAFQLYSCFCHRVITEKGTVVESRCGGVKMSPNLRIRAVIYPGPWPLIPSGDRPGCPHGCLPASLIPEEGLEPLIWRLSSAFLRKSLPTLAPAWGSSRGRPRPGPAPPVSGCPLCSGNTGSGLSKKSCGCWRKGLT